MTSFAVFSTHREHILSIGHILSMENTFYIEREHILSIENTFYL